MTVRELLQSIARPRAGRGARRRSTRRASTRRAPGVAYDSRARRARVACSSRCRGCTPTARAFAPQAVSRRRGGGRGRPPACRRSVGCPGCRVAMRASRWRCWPPSSTATRAGRCVWSASPAPTARRRPATSCDAIFEAAGIKCGLMGTVAYRIGDRVIEATRTTPEAPDVQALLRQMVDAGVRRLRDGGVVARAGAAARRRPAVRRRRVHQSHARPSRFPRQTWRATSRPSGGSSRCCRRDAPAVINVDDPRGAALVEVVAARRSPTASTSPPTSRRVRCRSRSTA